MVNYQPLQLVPTSLPGDRLNLVACLTVLYGIGQGIELKKRLRKCLLIINFVGKS
ncbi:hypothetical protein NIES39_D07350 [Arthrospira platensis NIES-39]|nr:hypothetical protein NIES39_D07350 [Arthrospira platensis NIES-39]